VAALLLGARLSLGPGFVLGYTLQGLFHPARKVRSGPDINLLLPLFISTRLPPPLDAKHQHRSLGFILLSFL
jgi:hypothetical protein